MIQEIKNCKELIPYLKKDIEDEGIEVKVDGCIHSEKLAIIKVDEYYNGLHVQSPPKSIDFVVAVDCECSWYVLYLLELKNVNSPKKLIVRDIKLYLVSDAYGLMGKYETFQDYKKIQERKKKIQNRDSLRVDLSLGSKLYRFRGKIVKIDYDFPPNPIIRKIS